MAEWSAEHWPTLRTRLAGMTRSPRARHGAPQAMLAGGVRPDNPPPRRVRGTHPAGRTLDATAGGRGADDLRRDAGDGAAGADDRDLHLERAGLVVRVAGEDLEDGGADLAEEPERRRA